MDTTECFSRYVCRLSSVVEAKIVNLAAHRSVRLPASSDLVPTYAAVAAGVIDPASVVLLVVGLPASRYTKIATTAIKWIAIAMLALTWIAILQPEDLTMHENGTLHSVRKLSSAYVATVETPAPLT